jgi:hypothetical protein
VSEQTADGRGTVTYAVEANTTAASRTGQIAAGGGLFTISQPACVYTLSSSAGTAPAAGGPLSVTMTTAAGCPWTVTPTAAQSWANTSTLSGTGTATITFNTQPNQTGNQRSTGFNIGSAVNARGFTITQPPQTTLPESCVTAVTPPTASAGSGQTQSSFAIAAAAGCNWTASSNASWFEIFPLTGTGAASIQWTVYPNFGSTSRTAIATIGDKTFTVTQSAGSGTLMQRFVRLLYFSFLARAASDGEVAAWVNSGQTRAQIASSFLNSPEFNLGGRFTAGLYVGIIDRDAEFTGWQFQRQALARGIVNQDQLVSNFLNSTEFNLKFPNLSNADFIRLMYENVLLRPASQTEVDAWLNVMANPANTRTIIARSFLNSPEFQQGTGPRLLAFLLYSTLLLRDGTPQERAALEVLLANPAQLAVVIEQFANGAEINGLLQ